MEIQFQASLPPIQSAINIGLDGMRIKLDIPETEIAEAVKLTMMRGKNLIVNIKIEEKNV